MKPWRCTSWCLCGRPSLAQYGECEKRSFSTPLCPGVLHPEIDRSGVGRNTGSILLHAV